LVLNLRIFGRAFGCIPALGGSIISKSAFSQLSRKPHKKSSTFLFTKVIFVIQFFAAFFSQSFEEEVISSTEWTLSAQLLANIIPIVPVHPYKSRTVQEVLVASSKTLEYNFSAQ